MASYHYYSFYWGLPLWTVTVNHIHVYCLVHKTRKTPCTLVDFSKKGPLTQKENPWHARLQMVEDHWNPQV